MPYIWSSIDHSATNRQDNFYYFPRFCLFASDTESSVHRFERSPLPRKSGAVRDRRLRVQQPRGKDGSLLDGGWTTDTLLYPGIAGWGSGGIRWYVHGRGGGRTIGDTNAIGHPLASRWCTGCDAHSRADDRALTLRLAHPQLILPLLFLLQVNLRVERLTGFRLLQHTHKPTVSLEPWLVG